jgi:hypothetical protein
LAVVVVLALDRFAAALPAPLERVDAFFAGVAPVA